MRAMLLIPTFFLPLFGGMAATFLGIGGRRALASPSLWRVKTVGRHLPSDLALVILAAILAVTYLVEYATRAFAPGFYYIDYPHWLMTIVIGAAGGVAFPVLVRHLPRRRSSPLVLRYEGGERASVHLNPFKWGRTRRAEKLSAASTLAQALKDEIADMRSVGIRTVEVVSPLFVQRVGSDKQLAAHAQRISEYMTAIEDLQDKSIVVAPVPLHQYGLVKTWFARLVYRRKPMYRLFNDCRRLPAAGFVVTL